MGLGEKSSTTCRRHVLDTSTSTTYVVVPDFPGGRTRHGMNASGFLRPPRHEIRVRGLFFIVFLVVCARGRRVETIVYGEASGKVDRK